VGEGLAYRPVEVFAVRLCLRRRVHVDIPDGIWSYYVAMIRIGRMRLPNK